MPRIIFSLFFMVLFPIFACAGTVPSAASDVVDEMDKQILRRLDGKRESRSEILLIGTVAVNLNNLNETNSLARQMTEEIMRLFVDKGYRANELRKRNSIEMQPRKGETLLTRELSNLASKDVKSVATLTGTYTVTPESIRFNMRLLVSATNEILATGSTTVPRTDEIDDLLDEKKKMLPPQPSVFTRLPD